MFRGGQRLGLSVQASKVTALPVRGQGFRIRCVRSRLENSCLHSFTVIFPRQHLQQKNLFAMKPLATLWHAAVCNYLFFRVAAPGVVGLTHLPPSRLAILLENVRAKVKPPWVYGLGLRAEPHTPKIQRSARRNFIYCMGGKP